MLLLLLSISSVLSYSDPCSSGGGGVVVVVVVLFVRENTGLGVLLFP